MQTALQPARLEMTTFSTKSRAPPRLQSCWGSGNRRDGPGVVIGGTGLIGSKVVALLGDQGHEAVPAAPNSGVNTLTGEGLAQALDGADVVALSVVGTERLAESGYFRAKIARERLISDSPIPYSIVHATQFFEFLKGSTDQATQDGVVRLAPVNIQPIASQGGVATVAEATVGAHRGTIRLEDWQAQAAAK